MKTTAYARALLINMIVGAASVIVLAGPQDVQTRSIGSPDFAGKRPQAPRSAPPRKRYSYNYLKTERSPNRSNATRKPAPGGRKPAAPKHTDIGITIWKMRPPQPGESGYMFSVTEDDGKRNLLLAERSSIDDVFLVGDKVRFAVESTTPGFLYVFDREMYADGQSGQPFLIFPESLGDNNYVAPGMIADIPDQIDDPPFFDITMKRPNYSGEWLTVIISPTPLNQFRVDNENGRLLNPDELVKLEFDGEAEIFSRTDKEDRIYTNTESRSSCGVRTRQLERPKSAKRPCGDSVTPLRPDEPLPQAIYRVQSVTGKPAVAFIRMAAKPSN